MTNRVHLFLVVSISLLYLSGCSTTTVSEKKESVTGRPGILEEDITTSPSAAKSDRAPVDSPSSGIQTSPPGWSSNTQPQPQLDQSSSTRTPRRFQWKDNR